MISQGEIDHTTIGLVPIFLVERVLWSFHGDPQVHTVSCSCDDKKRKVGGDLKEQSVTDCLIPRAA
jgi:hypothetical protein